MTDTILAEDGHPVKVWMIIHCFGREDAQRELMLNNKRCADLWVKHNLGEDWKYAGIHARMQFIYDGKHQWSMKRDELLITHTVMRELYLEWVEKDEITNAPHWWDNWDERPECDDDCRGCSD